MKYRRRAAIIIVIHDGKGCFDPLSDGKGDVYRLVEYLQNVHFGDALRTVAGLVGFEPVEPIWQRESSERPPYLSVAERWELRRKPWRGSAAWRYLNDARGLPDRIVSIAIGTNLLRAGPCGGVACARAQLVAVGDLDPAARRTD